MTVSHALIVALMTFTLMYSMTAFRHQPSRRLASDDQDTSGRQPPPVDSGEIPRRRMAHSLHCATTRSRLNDRVSMLLAVLAFASLTMAIASRYATAG